MRLLRGGSFTGCLWDVVDDANIANRGTIYAMISYRNQFRKIAVALFAERARLAAAVPLVAMRHRGTTAMQNATFVLSYKVALRISRARCTKYQ